MGWGSALGGFAQGFASTFVPLYIQKSQNQAVIDSLSKQYMGEQDKIIKTAQDNAAQASALATAATKQYGIDKTALDLQKSVTEDPSVKAAYAAQGEDTAKLFGKQTTALDTRTANSSADAAAWSAQLPKLTQMYQGQVDTATKAKADSPYAGLDPRMDPTMLKTLVANRMALDAEQTKLARGTEVLRQLSVETDPQKMIALAGLAKHYGMEPGDRLMATRIPTPDKPTGHVIGLGDRAELVTFKDGKWYDASGNQITAAMARGMTPGKGRSGGAGTSPPAGSDDPADPIAPGNPLKLTVKEAMKHGADAQASYDSLTSQLNKATDHKSLDKTMAEVEKWKFNYGKYHGYGGIDTVQAFFLASELYKKKSWEIEKAGLDLTTEK